jgi:phi LC3 family holin
MKINWEVRLKNPVWWFHVALAVVTPVLAYFGLTGADMTSWAKVGETILAAIANPYVVFLALVGAWNAVLDPTTANISDSPRALTYTEPYKEDK